MQRRSSTGSFRTSSHRVENRSDTEVQRQSSFADDALTEFRKTCKLCSGLCDLINGKTLPAHCTYLNIYSTDHY